jgi:hypothetical protein
VGATDGGTGDEDSGADGFPEGFGVGGGGWHGNRFWDGNGRVNWYFADWRLRVRSWWKKISL